MWAKTAMLGILAMVLSSCSANPTPGVSFLGHGREAAQDYAELDRAIELISQLRYDEAANMLTTLATGFESAHDISHGADATFWLGYCREKQGRTAEAIVWYRRLLERYPQLEAARLAQDRLDSLTMPSPSTGPG